MLSFPHKKETHSRRPDTRIPGGDGGYCGGRGCGLLDPLVDLVDLDERCSYRQTLILVLILHLVLHLVLVLIRDLKGGIGGEGIGDADMPVRTLVLALVLVLVLAPVLVLARDLHRAYLLWLYDYHCYCHCWYGLCFGKILDLDLDFDGHPDSLLLCRPHQVDHNLVGHNLVDYILVDCNLKYGSQPLGTMVDRQTVIQHRI